MLEGEKGVQLSTDYLPSPSNSVALENIKQRTKKFLVIIGIAFRN